MSKDPEPTATPAKKTPRKSSGLTSTSANATPNQQQQRRRSLNASGAAGGTPTTSSSRGGLQIAHYRYISGYARTKTNEKVWYCNRRYKEEKCQARVITNNASRISDLIIFEANLCDHNHDRGVDPVADDTNDVVLKKVPPTPHNSRRVSHITDPSAFSKPIRRRSNATAVKRTAEESPPDPEEIIERLQQMAVPKKKMRRSSLPLSSTSSTSETPTEGAPVVEAATKTAREPSKKTLDAARSPFGHSDGPAAAALKTAREPGESTLKERRPLVVRASVSLRPVSAEELKTARELGKRTLENRSSVRRAPANSLSISEGSTKGVATAREPGDETLRGRSTRSSTTTTGTTTGSSTNTGATTTTGSSQESDTSSSDEREGKSPTISSSREVVLYKDTQEPGPDWCDADMNAGR